MNQFLIIISYLLGLIDSWIMFCIGWYYVTNQFNPQYFNSNQINCMCLLPIINQSHFTHLPSQLLRIQLDEFDPCSFDMNYYNYESLLSIVFIVSYPYYTGEMILSSMRSIPYQYKFTIGIQPEYPYQMPYSRQIPLKIRIK